MELLTVKDLSIELEGKPLLESISFSIRTGECTAMIGENGIGKTTLLKAIFGIIPIDEGEVHHSSNLNLGWMEQNPVYTESETVTEFVEQENNSLRGLKIRLQEYEKKLPAQAMGYSMILQQYMDAGGFEWEAKVERNLLEARIPKELWGQPFASLSGGQKTRVQLARVLMNDPEFLVLDEPTNHLDDESLQWLQDWMLKFKGTILFISHDRAFIDAVADSTMELTPTSIMKVNGGYTSFIKQKELDRQTQTALYEKQEQERKNLEETIRKYRQWFAIAHQSAGERNPFAKKRAMKNITRAQSKEKALGKLESERVEKPKDKKGINLAFEHSEMVAKRLISVEHASFSYPNGPGLFNRLSFEVKKEDRIAVIGKNGSGKTTLLKLLIGELMPETGEIKRHPKLKVGYFAQEVEKLNENHSLLDSLLDIPQMTQTDARTLLACFLFRKEDVHKTIKNLSMGEKCRLAFIRLYLSQADLLVLDEPTNYLDLPSRETIDDALESYPGAVVIVSHDAYLLKKMANRILAIEDGNVHDFKDTFQAYHEWKKESERSMEDKELEGFKKQLALRYTQLIHLEENDPDKNKQILQQLKDINNELAKLEEKGY
ncbi:ribosomal protection-like ABC-F family protein [Falsibacillus albus]|uniref:ABC-F type ribosomal protection protein n=1 Tax=Falsibacillus albus TaxID=2478915 RepID=A0A3L7JUS6_9BACI|nr:ABC-F type ribosomal protection protein [Falsibacillus albus]RLQ94250.1 ABC-F type ribosomal protection protein [Falsibacillus albus]